MPAKSYDLIVIGTGSAASVGASRCREAGWAVSVIDVRPFGGTCALRGCDPKKVLVAAAEALDWGHRLTGRGVQPGVPRIDWPELMAFKRTFTEPVPGVHERWFAELGIDALHGRATFNGPTSLRVGDADLAAERVVIASGATPARLSRGVALAEHPISFTGSWQPQGCPLPAQEIVRIASLNLYLLQTLA